MPSHGSERKTVSEEQKTSEEIPYDNQGRREGCTCPYHKFERKGWNRDCLLKCEPNPRAGLVN